MPEFVSQDQGRHRYHAVRCANIYVRFANRDASGIGLIDLPGLDRDADHDLVRAEANGTIAIDRREYCST